MNKTSLSALYRRLTATTATPTLDADDLASAADGTLTDDRREGVAQALAGSARDTKLVRMLRELKVESEALAFGIARTQRETTHRRRDQTERRVAAGHRFGGATRWATALAACLVAVVGVWTMRNQQVHAPRGTHSVAKADEIFNSRMEGPSQQQKVRVEGDRLFHADFSGG